VVNGAVYVCPLTTAVAMPVATSWPFCTEILVIVGTTLLTAFLGGFTFGAACA